MRFHLKLLQKANRQGSCEVCTCCPYVPILFTVRQSHTLSRGAPKGSHPLSCWTRECDWCLCTTEASCWVITGESICFCLEGGGCGVGARAPVDSHIAWRSAFVWNDEQVNQKSSAWRKASDASARLSGFQCDACSHLCVCVWVCVYARARWGCHSN